MKIWSTEKADSVLSKEVIKLNPICVRCRQNPSTDCSHFWERHHSATRFNYENVDALCRECHQIWEGRKNGYKEYKMFMLGDKEYDELEKLHNKIIKRDDAIIKFMKNAPKNS